MSISSSRSTLYTSSAERCPADDVSNTFRIFRRGRVALSPIFLRSSGVFIAV